MKIRLLLLLLLIGCNQKIVHFLNHEADFESFESYRLVNVKIDRSQLSREGTQLLDLIEAQIHHHMQEVRNYSPVKRSPDLILRYELVSNTSSQVNQNNPNYYYQFPSTTVQIVYESIILLELMHNNKLVWQGSYDLRQSNRQEKFTKTVKEAIDLIFTTYPYRAASGKVDPSLITKKKK